MHALRSLNSSVSAVAGCAPHDRAARVTRHAPRGVLASAVFVASVLAAPSLSRGEDVVFVAASQEGQGRVRRTGEIIDYTGRSLILRTTGGAETTIPAERVVEVRTEWTAPHRRGDELFAEDQFAEALEQYREAARQEGRAWVRRRLIARAVWCYRNLQQPENAASAFLALVAEDSTTQDFDAIPLTWTSAQPGAAFERRLVDWLGGDNSVAKLLAASWLLTGRQRDQAAAALEELAKHADSRIAALAEAQLWRTRQATADAEDAACWRESLSRFPEPLRAGPYYVLGTVLARRQDPHAALTLLRVPVLYPRHRELAAEALVAAARELEKRDRRDEAHTLYRELTTDYPESPLASLAEQRLEAILEN